MTTLFETKDQSFFDVLACPLFVPISVVSLRFLHPIVLCLVLFGPKSELMKS